MKIQLFILLLLSISSINAQSSDNDTGNGNGIQKLQFSYDIAGNQTSRKYIVVSNRLANKNSKQIKNLVASDLLTSDVSEEIKFYPNPVQEDLFIQWIETVEKKVVQLQLFNMSGQLLKTFPNNKGNDSMTINFQDFPSGIFNLILEYASADKKVLKIVKK